MATQRELSLLVTLKDQATKELKGLQSQLQDFKPLFQTMAVAGTATFGAVALAIGESIKKASDFQQTTVAFETMLGSAEKAKNMLQQLTQFAAKTPFQLSDVEVGTKRLLAYGIESGKVIDTLKVLGDIAAGVGMDKLPFLITALGQVHAKTVLSGEELKQFTETGVPLIEELAKVTGHSVGEIVDGTKDLRISYDQVVEALTNMTGEHGKFFNLMDKQSKTAAGLWSTVKDNIDITMRTLGQQFLPTIQKLLTIMIPVLQALGNWVQAHPKLTVAILLTVGALGGLVAILGLIGLFISPIITQLALLTVTYGSFSAVVAAGTGAIATTMGILMGTILPVIAIIGGLIYIIYNIIQIYKLWQTSHEEIIMGFKLYWEDFKNFFIGIWQNIMAFFQPVLAFFTGVGTQIKEIWNTVITAISDAWQFGWLFIQEFVKNIFGLIVGSIITLLDTFIPNWQQYLSTMYNIVVSVFSAIQTFVVTVWTAVTTFITNVWLATTNWLGTQFLAIYNQAMLIFNQLKAFLNLVWTAISTTVKAVWNDIKTFFGTLWDGIKQTFFSAVDSIIQKLEPLITFIEKVKQKLEDMKNAASNAVSSAGSALSSGFNSVINSGRSALGIHDGVITPDGRVIKTDPKDYIIATKTPGSLLSNNNSGGQPLQVVVTGNTFVDMDDMADHVFSVLEKKLKYRMKLSSSSQ